MLIKPLLVPVIGLTLLAASPVRAGIVVTWGAPIPEGTRDTTYTSGRFSQVAPSQETDTQQEVVPVQAVVEAEELQQLMAALFWASLNPPSDPQEMAVELGDPMESMGAATVVGHLDGDTQGGCAASPLSLWTVLVPLGWLFRRRRSRA